MKLFLRFLVLSICSIPMSSVVFGQSVFINEIHYDNSGSDSEEGIEVAGRAGTELNGWSLILYNGNGGTPYNTVNLSGVLPNQQLDFGTAFFAVPGLQNGSPDGVALVNSNNEVIQFLSYEGSFAAVGGPADGMVSEEIGVAESSSTPSGYSLQLAGTGTNYEEFSWEGPFPATYHHLNANQSFGGETERPEVLEVTIAAARHLPLGTEVKVSGVLSLTNQLGGPAFFQDSSGGIPIFDELIHANDSLQIGDSLQIRAKVGSFNGQVQLIGVTEVAHFGQANNPILPQEVGIAQLDSMEGELVTIQAYFTTKGGLLFPNSNYQVQDSSGTTDVRIDDNVESLVGRRVPKGTVNVTGVVGSFRGMLQIFPRFYADLPAAEPYEQAGDTIPAEQTLDVASWNMEFFGADLPNFGPPKKELQLENAVKVLNGLNADIIAVQEVSSDSLLAVLAGSLEGNWAIRCSDAYSYSFQPSDNFPAQKLCFIYNTEVVEVVQERVVFEEFYEQIRTGGSAELLPDYPVSASSFWASGRLPYQLTVNATVEGVTEQITLFNIHGISNSGGLQSYQRRLYDVQVLKDTLDAYYANKQIIILGDYNDDVDEPVAEEVQSEFSPYEIFVEDTTYFVPTLSLSMAGFRSYVFADNMIDHITISEELLPELITGSAATFIPFHLIKNFSSTTSDHLPVKVRFELVEPLMVEVNGDPRVFYGYKPEACTILSTRITGGKGDYTYHWNTGETSDNIEVCPSLAQTYTVRVQDESGQVESQEIQVCVTDVSCGSNFETDKVEMCYKVGRGSRSVSLCLPEHLVPFFSARGAKLGYCWEEGECEETEKESIQKSDRLLENHINVDEEISIRRNLHNRATTIQFVALEEGLCTLNIYGLDGKLVEQLYTGFNEFGTLQEVNLEKHSMPKGIYLLQLKSQSGAVFNRKIIF